MAKVESSEATRRSQLITSSQAPPQTLPSIMAMTGAGCSSMARMVRIRGPRNVNGSRPTGANSLISCPAEKTLAPGWARRTTARTWAAFMRSSAAMRVSSKEPLNALCALGRFSVRVPTESTMCSSTRSMITFSDPPPPIREQGLGSSLTRAIGTIGGRYRLRPTRSAPSVPSGTLLRLKLKEVANSQDIHPLGLIRFPGISCAFADVWSGADALDLFGIQAHGTQAPHCLVLQFVIITVHSNRPVMTPEVMPQILHRIQLRRVRHQLDQAQIPRDLQVRTGVVARSVPQQHRMDPSGQRARELLEEQIEHRRVQLRHDQRRRRARGHADRRQHIERRELDLPHRTRARTLQRPDARQRPVLAEAGLVLEPELDLLVGMRLLDRLDLIDDDLLEDLLEFLVGILVLGSGHQAAETELVQQVVNGLEAQEHAELVLEDALEVAAVERTDAVLGLRPRLQPLLEAEPLRPGEARRSSGMGPLGERVRTTLVELGDPGLDGAWATAEGVGDPVGGAALAGENDRLRAEPDAFLGDVFGPALEFVEGQVVVDIHGEAPGVNRGAPSCPTGGFSGRNTHKIPGKRISQRSRPC